MKKNDELARALRDRFRAAGCFVVSLVSSPGTGKTEFLTQLMKLLNANGDLKIAALVGDLRTDNDAKRLAAAGRAGAADRDGDDVPPGGGHGGAGDR